MQIQIAIKQLGRKRPVLRAEPIEIDLLAGKTYRLQEVFEAVVKQQVAEFNQKRDEKNLFTYLQEDGADTTGKVDFGAIYNEQKADLERAINTVLLAFEDGLIAVFVDDTQIEQLDAEIQLQETSLFTFVRLTFLAGGIW